MLLPTIRLVSFAGVLLNLHRSTLAGARQITSSTSLSQNHLSQSSICYNENILQHPRKQCTISHSFPQSRKMSSITQSDPAIREILLFWFGMNPKNWFMGGPSQDKIITERFKHLVEKARLTNELDLTWTSTPEGSLAMVILLDQFTRNIYRVGNHPEPGLSFSGDAKALRIASEAIAKGFDRQMQKDNESKVLLGFPFRYFFYVPFMHSEDLAAQIACGALYEVMKQEFEVSKAKRIADGKFPTEEEEQVEKAINAGVDFAKKHLNCILAVGRFPKRNEPLGREHEDADRKWLEKYPKGF